MKNVRYEIVVNNEFSGNVFANAHDVFKQNEFHGIVKGNLEFYGVELYNSTGAVVYFIDGCQDVRVDGNIIYIER